MTGRYLSGYLTGELLYSGLPAAKQTRIVQAAPYCQAIETRVHEVSDWQDIIFGNMPIVNNPCDYGGNFLDYRAVISLHSLFTNMLSGTADLVQAASLSAFLALLKRT